MTETNISNICTVCGKPVNGDCYAGVRTRHKECHKQKSRENRAAKIDYYRAYDRDRFQNNPERRARQLKQGKAYQRENPQKAMDATRKYRKENPARYIANNLINNMLRDGKIEKPGKCEICEAQAEHAHHHDYTKPNDVWWLCVDCHSRLHRLMRNVQRRRIQQ